MDENTPWTTIDIYYKGFHVKKSFPNNIKSEDLKEKIDDLIEKGFEPSWNAETSKSHIESDTQREKAINDWTGGQKVLGEETKLCLVHNVEMKKYTKEDRSWFSHSYITKTGEKIYCSGNGWKNPKVKKFIENPEDYA